LIGILEIRHGCAKPTGIKNLRLRIQTLGVNLTEMKKIGPRCQSYRDEENASLTKIKRLHVCHKAPYRDEEELQQIEGTEG
jgi:hypothetical protein